MISASQTYKSLNLMPLYLVIIIDSMGPGIMLATFGLLLNNEQMGILRQPISPELRYSLYGLILGVGTIIMFLTTPLWGTLSDQLGKKSILVICMLGTTLGYLTLSIAVNDKNISIFILGRFLISVTAGSISIAQSALIDNSVHSNKSARIGLSNVFGGLGLILGALLAGITSDNNLYLEVTH